MFAPGNPANARFRDDLRVLTLDRYTPLLQQITLRDNGALLWPIHGHVDYNGSRKLFFIFVLNINIPFRGGISS